jgi:hypothetical protein
MATRLVGDARLPENRGGKEVLGNLVSFSR